MIQDLVDILPLRNAFTVVVIYMAVCLESVQPKLDSIWDSGYIGCAMSVMAVNR